MFILRYLIHCVQRSGYCVWIDFLPLGLCSELHFSELYVSPFENLNINKMHLINVITLSISSNFSLVFPPQFCFISCFSSFLFSPVLPLSALYRKYSGTQVPLIDCIPEANILFLTPAAWSYSFSSVGEEECVLL